MSVQNCVNACRAWSAPYDGEHPTVESFSDEHKRISAGDGHVMSKASQDAIPASWDELNTDGVNLKECVYKRVETPAEDLANTTVALFEVNGLISSDGGITQAQEIPAPLSSSAVCQVTSESVTDGAEVSADGDDKREQTHSELLHLPSSSNLEPAEPVVPPRHLSPAATSDDLESFFRQLSHVSCKSDSDDGVVDILTEFDEVINQLDASTEDLDSQKTLTPDDPSAEEFPENIRPQSENNVSAVENSDLVATVASSDGTDNVPSFDDSVVKPHEEKVLDSAADDDNDIDKDADDNDGLYTCSKTSSLSSLLYCKFEPSYLPTIGMYTCTLLMVLSLES